MQVSGQLHALTLLSPGKERGTHRIGGDIVPRASPLRSTSSLNAS